MQIKLKLTCAEEPVEDVHSGWVGHTANIICQHRTNMSEWASAYIAHVQI